MQLTRIRVGGSLTVKEMAGRRDEAFAAYDKAISLTTEIPVRLWLEAQRREQSGD